MENVESDMDKKLKVDKRQAIMDVARQCFIAHGFHATGMAELSQAAGMSAGNLYRYFPNKEAIIQAIVDDTRMRVAPIYERLQSHPDPVEGIVEIIEHIVGEFCHGPESRLWIEVIAEASRSESVRKTYLKCDHEMRVILKKLLQRAIDARGMGGSPGEAEAGVIWLSALVDGALARMAVDPDADLASMMAILGGGIRKFLRP